jgi:ABC-type sugar transport system ATPase subunit
VIQFEHITKTFTGVTALDDVSLSITRGETHALMGENGAGKSTLGKCCAGSTSPTRHDPHRRQAGQLPLARGRNRAGVGMVHQELAFCPDLSVAENLCMGHYPRRLGVLVNKSRCARRRASCSAHRRDHLDVTQPMRALSTAQEQLVQIASAVGTGADVLVFDEPTSSLSEPEAQQLFALMGQLKSRGVTMIYVSHRMPEVFRLCDRISVLRDGKYVGTLDRAEATEDQVVRMMIGRSVEAYLPQHSAGRAGTSCCACATLARPGNSRTSASRSRPARSSASPGWSARGAARLPRRSSDWTRARPAASSSTAGRCRWVKSARRSAAESACCRRTASDRDWS